MTEPDNLVLSLLREMRVEMADMRAEMKTGFSDVDAKINSLAADVASDLLTIEKRLSEQVAGLRRAVMEYHSTAIGHGVLFTEIEERVRKIEQHLHLTA